MSPIITIKRPQNRVPLGQIQLCYHDPGSPQRRLSREFKLYEDPKHAHVSPTKDLSPKKSNNKENIPPFAMKRLAQWEEEDVFVRPLPRGALAKLRRQSDEEIIVMDEMVITEEVIRTEYFAGARIITEAHRTSITRTSQHHNPDDQQHTTHTTEHSPEFQTIQTQHQIPEQNRIQPVKETLEFEIFHDDPQDLEMANYNIGVDNIMLEEEEEKENADPGVHGDSGDELDWHGERKSRSHKRKAQEDWN